jgi:hypothetical protein
VIEQLQATQDRLFWDDKNGGGKRSKLASRARGPYARVCAMKLPELPRHAFTLVEERPSLDPPGFLGLKRMILRVRFADGAVSEPRRCPAAAICWVTLSTTPTLYMIWQPKPGFS